MKRHKVLEPFSRDHYEGLVVARHLMKDRDESALLACMKVWDEDMQDHFSEEEALLSEMASPEMATRLRQEHEEIRHMVISARIGQLGPNDIYTLGQKIYNHIRWEERVLFPAVEQSESIESIGPATDAMEKRRHNASHPLRAEQVNRRANRV